MPHCKRCHVEISRTVKECPSCHYSPKDRGLRLSLWCFFIFVLSMIGAQLSLSLDPMIALYLMLLAAIAFFASLLVFIVSMMATPYRLGRLFLRV